MYKKLINHRKIKKDSEISQSLCLEAPPRFELFNHYKNPIERSVLRYPILFAYTLHTFNFRELKLIHIYKEYELSSLLLTFTTTRNFFLLHVNI